MTGPGGAGPDLDELLRLAEAATPGPWQLTPGGVLLGLPHSVHTLAQWVTQMIDTVDKANEVYIAAASPDVVAALVGRVRAAEGETATCREALDGVREQLQRPWKERWAERFEQVAQQLETRTSQLTVAERDRDDALRIAERHRAENDKLRVEVERLTVLADHVAGDVETALAERDVARAELADAQAELRRWNETAAVAHDRDVELADAHRAEDQLRTFVEGCARHGIHADTMPTMKIGEPTEILSWFYGYLDDADQSMRKSAQQALAAASRPSSLADTEQVEVKTMRWARPPSEHPLVQSVAEANAQRVVAWVNANGGEARYEPGQYLGLTEYAPGRIAIRQADGTEDYAYAGYEVVKGEPFVVNDDPGQRDQSQMVCEFTVRRAADTDGAET